MGTKLCWDCWYFSSVQQTPIHPAVAKLINPLWEGFSYTNSSQP